MTGQRESVLLQRVCFRCTAVFRVCQRCDCGQRYCSPACRAAARLQQRRSANLREQQTPTGRLNHCDRQRRYRLRLAEEHRQLLAEKLVTDHSSLTIPDGSRCDGSSSSPCVEPRADQNTAFVPCWSPQASELLPRCIVCGCTGRVVIVP
jgi:hypothetical protein